MRKMVHIPVFALAGALALFTPATAAAQQETERVDRTASIRAGGELRVKNFSGKVTITGIRRGDIAIQAIRRATARSARQHQARGYRDRIRRHDRGKPEG